MNDWIFAADELPIHAGQYLCVIKENDLYFKGVCEYVGVTGRWIMYAADNTQEVVAWMPTPKMPRHARLDEKYTEQHTKKPNRRRKALNNKMN